jgi:hypothetical protein
MSIRRLASYRGLRRALLIELRLARRANWAKRIREIRTEMAEVRLALTGGADVTETGGAYLTHAERVAVAKAKAQVIATGETVTVWHDCGALEPFIRAGRQPDPTRACQRIATVALAA